MFKKIYDLISKEFSGKNTKEVIGGIANFHRIQSSPHTVVLTAGGVFNRAEGLWIEVGADEFAPDARSALAKARRGIALREHFVAIEGQPKRRRRRKTLLNPAG